MRITYRREVGGLRVPEKNIREDSGHKWPQVPKRHVQPAYASTGLLRLAPDPRVNMCYNLDIFIIIKIYNKQNYNMRIECKTSTFRPNSRGFDTLSVHKI